MKTKSFFIFLSLVIPQGLLVLIFLSAMTFDATRGGLIDYQVLRLVLGIIFSLFLLLLCSVLVGLLKSKSFSQRVGRLGDRINQMNAERFFLIQTLLILLSLFMFECTLVTYLAFPEPLRPFFLWAALIAFQAWLFLRITCNNQYHRRGTFYFRAKKHWQGFLPIQRKTLFILAVIGVIYILAFSPLNFIRDGKTHLFIHPDEEVIYPDIVRVLLWQGSLDATVHNVMDYWQWWYGYPYLPISASVLVIPRLIFGESFGNQVQMNMFLLRQFVSVVPMTLALFLLVYLVTRYKNRLYSIGMFVFLLLIPGVVKFNFHFWHPDGIILLLILLTFYFLEKDDLRFGKNFYLAAVMCTLALAIKLWGAFFFLAIAGYLIAGMYHRKIKLRKMVLTGTAFLVVMLVTLLISSPTLMVPYVVRGALVGWELQQGALLGGYAEADPEGVYQTGLLAWLKHFKLYYMEIPVFFISWGILAASSLLGSQKRLSRLILAWCLPTALFLINFTSMKSNHYMIPLMIPLYGGLFLLPYLLGESEDGKDAGFLSTPRMKKIIWAALVLVVGIQFVFNLVNIITSDAVGINIFLATFK